jgi:redox-sensing transcriptional repressor
MKTITEPALRRLPAYLNYINKLDKKLKFVSSSAMALDLGLAESQARKDLAALNIKGLPRLGYKRKELVEVIEDFLGHRNLEDAVLVGAGNLGAALLQDGGFVKRGISILAAFDSNPLKQNTEINNVKIFHISKLNNLVKRLGVKIGIIAVPAKAAENIALQLIDAQIEAIWNFAPISLGPYDDIIIENADIYTSLSVLKGKLTEKYRI